MNSQTRQIRALAARLAELDPVESTDVGLLGVMAGAVHSLEKARQLGYKDPRGQSRDVRVFGSEFRSALKRIGKGDPPPQSWVAGFYFMSALMRLAALLDRLKLPKAARSRSRVVHDVDWVKHRDDAHPVSRITTSWDDALTVAEAICGKLEAKLRE